MVTNTIVLSFIYLMGIGFLLFINELMYRKMSVKAEVSRKAAHFLSTLATVPFPYIFPSHWYVLILASIFFAILLFTKRGTKLGSIHNIERKTMGSYMLPAAIYVTFLVSDIQDNKLIYILPMLILAISDPIAAIVGIGLEKNNHKIIIGGYHTNKSLFGSTAFFISALLISLIAIYFNLEVFTTRSIGMAFAVAGTSTIVELFCQRGIDNLCIPLSCVLMILLFQ